MCAFQSLNEFIRKQKEKAGGESREKFYTPEERIPAMRGWWVRVPKKWWQNDLKGLSFAERCVLISLKTHDNRRFGCFPSLRTLAKELDSTPKTILKAIRSLKEKGFLEVVVRRGRFNSYILSI